MKSNKTHNAGLLCAHCNHKLVDQKDIIPHRYKNVNNNERPGILAYLNEDNGSQMGKSNGMHKRSSSSIFLWIF